MQALRETVEFSAERMMEMLDPPYDRQHSKVSHRRLMRLRVDMLKEQDDYADVSKVLVAVRRVYTTSIDVHAEASLRKGADSLLQWNHAFQEYQAMILCAMRHLESLQRAQHTA